MKIVDIHPHIISKDTDRYPITPIGGKRSDWSDKHSADLGELIASMDAFGVDRAAVVHSSTTYGFNCDYVADAIAQYPERLTGVFSVDVMAPDAVQAMKKWIGKGMTGMRVFSRGSTIKGTVFAIDDPTIFPCYEYAGEAGIPVVTNVTHDKFDQLETVLKTFPQVTFVVDHMGGTDFAEGAPFDAARRIAHYTNLNFKVSSRTFTRAKQDDSAEELFPKLVSEIGAHRLAWASNFPANEGTYGDLLNLAKQGLRAVSDEDRAWILGKTAMRLYPVLADAEKVAG